MAGHAGFRGRCHRHATTTFGPGRGPRSFVGAAVLLGIAVYATGGAAPAAAATPAARNGTADVGTRRAASPALCVAPARTDRLRARRSSQAVARPVSGPPGGVVVTITKSTLVHGLARTLCGLPVSLPGRVACPMFIGPTYTLWFSSGRHAFPPVTVQTGGCEPVRGLGPTRWAIRSPALWRLLGAVFATGHVSP